MKYGQQGKSIPVVDWSEFHVWSPNGVFKRLKKENNIYLPPRRPPTYSGIEEQYWFKPKHRAVTHPDVIAVVGKQNGVLVKPQIGHERPGLMLEAYVQFGAGALGKSLFLNRIYGYIMVLDFSLDIVTAESAAQSTSMHSSH